MVSRRLIGAIAAWHDIHANLLQLTMTDDKCVGVKNDQVREIEPLSRCVSALPSLSYRSPTDGTKDSSASSSSSVSVSPSSFGSTRVSLDYRATKNTTMTVTTLRKVPFLSASGHRSSLQSVSLVSPDSASINSMITSSNELEINHGGGVSISPKVTTTFSREGIGEHNFFSSVAVVHPPLVAGNVRRKIKEMGEIVDFW